MSAATLCAGVVVADVFSITKRMPGGASKTWHISIYSSMEQPGTSWNSGRQRSR